MKRINKNSRFKRLFKFTKNGTSVSPSDFEEVILEFYTALNKPYTAKVKGETTENCKLKEEGLLVLFQNHSLGTGTIQLKVTTITVDEDFEDGIDKKEYIKTLDIMLVDDITNETMIDTEVFNLD